MMLLLIFSCNSITKHSLIQITHLVRLVVIGDLYWASTVEERRGIGLGHWYVTLQWYLLFFLDFEFIVSCGRFKLVSTDANWHLLVKRFLLSCKEGQVILIERVNRLCG
jgi:hypothetical protein